MTCGLEPRAIVAGIPLGSKLTDLDRQLGTFYESSNVDQWLPERTPATSNKPIATSFGLFFVRHLGSYPSWSPSKPELETFTGELTFTHYSDVIPDDLAPSFSIRLIYVGGVLKAKDFGFCRGDDVSLSVRLPIG